MPADDFSGVQSFNILVSPPSFTSCPVGVSSSTPPLYPCSPLPRCYFCVMLYGGMQNKAGKRFSSKVESTQLMRSLTPAELVRQLPPVHLRAVCVAGRRHSDHTQALASHSSMQERGSAQPRHGSVLSVPGSLALVVPLFRASMGYSPCHGRLQRCEVRILTSGIRHLQASRELLPGGVRATHSRSDGFHPRLYGADSTGFSPGTLPRVLVVSG